LRGRVLLTEALGSEILAHVELSAKAVVTEDVVEGAVVHAEEQEVAADLMGDSGDSDKTTFVGRFDPASRVKPDSDVELAVDTEKLQFFDLETGFAV
jgi:multiple sugar transport system ATP-binding protein